MTRQQMLVLAIMVFFLVVIVGCFGLIALGKVVPF